MGATPIVTGKRTLYSLVFSASVLRGSAPPRLHYPSHESRQLQRQIAEADAAGVEHGVSDCRRDGDERCLAGSDARQVRALDQVDVDLRRDVGEARDRVLPERRVGDLAARELARLAQRGAECLDDAADDL